jgi:hypothetical protein
MILYGFVVMEKSRNCLRAELSNFKGIENEGPFWAGAVTQRRYVSLRVVAVIDRRKVREGDGWS